MTTGVSQCACCRCDEKNVSPKVGRVPIPPISRPDGGSPLTPRKRSRTGGFTGPVPLFVGRSAAAGNASSSDDGVHSSSPLLWPIDLMAACADNVMGM